MLLELEEQVILHPLAQQRAEAALLRGARVHQRDVQKASAGERVVNLREEDGNVALLEHGSHAQARDGGDALLDLLVQLELDVAESSLDRGGVHRGDIGEERSVHRNACDVGELDALLQSCCNKGCRGYIIMSVIRKEGKECLGQGNIVKGQYLHVSSYKARICGLVFRL